VKVCTFIWSQFRRIAVNRRSR